jgi:branched-chain amino acid transport system permease protein
MVAVRDNERAAAAFGISPARVTLGAFAISGTLAGVAGCLMVHLVGSFDEATYDTEASVVVFTAAVVGGLGSLVGAPLGAGYLIGADWLLPGTSDVGQTLGMMFDLLPTAVGVLVVLLVLPGGLGGLAQRGRDGWLRSVARRHGLIVPGLAGAPPDGDGALGGALAAERDLEQLLVDPGAAPAPPSAGGGDEHGEGAS